MLFLLKRTWPAALAGLAVLTGLGIGLRWVLAGAPPVLISPLAALLGVGLFATVVASDLLLHEALSFTFGQKYVLRHRALAAVFRGQTAAAMLAGAAMAGVGEELVFRGLGASPYYLAGAAVLFGLMHHVRRSLWPFTLWAIWQGLLLAAALYWTGNLFVVMEAHFLHDLSGFLVFRYLNARAAFPSMPAGSSPR
jgi:membrane protease YdiL (CAAX protease family)